MKKIPSPILKRVECETPFYEDEQSPTKEAVKASPPLPKNSKKASGSSGTRGNYKNFSLEEKQSIISLIEDKKETFESLAGKFATTVRRVKAIFKKRGMLQKSGRKSRNLFENQFFFTKGLEFFKKFGVRPSILALPRFFRGVNDFFKSNGQKTNFTSNFKKYLLKEGCLEAQIKLNPLNETTSLDKLKLIYPNYIPVVVKPEETSSSEELCFLETNHQDDFENFSELDNERVTIPPELDSPFRCVFNEESEEQLENQENYSSLQVSSKFEIMDNLNWESLLNLEGL